MDAFWLCCGDHACEMSSCTRLCVMMEAWLVGICAPTLDVVGFLVECQDRRDVTFASWI
jgi:hypothetical protein